MKSQLFTMVLLGILSFASSGSALEQTILLPPESIAQWYKPSNKRQVWLHTMFGLRREMQAVEEYTVLEDGERLAIWARRLVDHYVQIGEMVPEWRDELELEWAAALIAAAERRDYLGVAKAQRKLSTSCKSCHRDYRAVTAAIYRTPDYGSLVVVNSQTGEESALPDVMRRLSKLVNRIKIATEDERPAIASGSLQHLNQRLTDLKRTCTNCHREGVAEERILGDERQALVAELQSALEARDPKLAGRKLGTLAVEICARCHGIHRTLYDLKQTIAD